MYVFVHVRDANSILVSLVIQVTLVILVMLPRDLSQCCVVCRVCSSLSLLKLGTQLSACWIPLHPANFSTSIRNPDQYLIWGPL